MAAEPLVVVSGIPGSGKTTLARRLAPALALPLLSKDTIKEALYDGLGSGDAQWVQDLGRASHLVLLAVAAQSAGAVVEAHFQPGMAESGLVAIGRPMVQVWCRCPVEVAVARYRRRIDDPARHPGHRPEHQDDAAIAPWRARPPAPLAIDPVVVVDTDRAVEVDDVVATIRGFLGR